MSSSSTANAAPWMIWRSGWRLSEDIFTDDIGQLRGLQRQAEHEMADLLGIHARIKLVEPHSIERSMGKSRRVIDRREVYDH